MGTMSKRPRNSRRSGFTLLELLVVISIIAILMSIALWVAGGLLETSRYRATEAMMGRLVTAAQEQTEQFYRVNRRSQVLWTNRIPALGQQFPYANKAQLTLIAQKAAYYDWMNKNGGLYDQIDDSFKLEDAWGQPVRMYLWPTRFFRAEGIKFDSKGKLLPPDSDDVSRAVLALRSASLFSGNLANDLNRDPDDPLQQLLFLGKPDAKGNPTYDPSFELAFHTPVTWHVVLFVSAGPDRLLGIYEPTDTANLGQLAQPKPLKLLDPLRPQLGYDPDGPPALDDNVYSICVLKGGR